MSLLTISKLTDSVGAEVAGLDPASLASHDPVSEAVLDALEDNGVLVFRGLNLTRRLKLPSAAGSARSTTPRTVTTPSQGSTRSPWTSPRIRRPTT